MTGYDANIAPPPADWLATRPAEKLRRVVGFHATHQLASSPYKSHAALHVVVEDQLARGDGPMVRAMARLQQQGMTRHDALHEVGEVRVSLLRRQADAPDRGDGAAWQGRLNEALAQLGAPA